MSVVEVNKRKVRSLNSEAEMAIASAKMAFREANRELAQMMGERDPVKLQRQGRAASMAITDAIQDLEDAHVFIRNIDEICVMEARRGSYKKP